MIARFQPNDEKLVVGGRSMRGRISSQVVAQCTPVHALALFADPLNPPYNRALSRDGHLPDIAVPILFCSGTRDNFASPGDLVAGRSEIIPGARAEENGNRDVR